MVKEYFLASNSANGFFSLYGSFPPDGAYLHIIKGGPGTGKSSFMHAIGKMAEENGCTAEYVLCSGDPSSLDGVYVPQLKAAWMDGTAPHTAEPRLFGVRGDYVNLGQFCQTPLLPDDASEAARLDEICKTEYSAAYTLLSEAGAARKCGSFDTSEQYRARRMFLSAISRKGKVSLYEKNSSGFKDINVSRLEMDDAVSELKMSAECILCLDPLIPVQVETVIMQNCRTLIRCAEDNEISDELISKASGHIRAAGLAHDVLEEIYKKYMDYDALNEFTNKYLKRLFCVM